jgi:cob(I)alamin adenosyltransferase
LDDQKLVAKFEGKQVKVIGTLDAANSQIHVQRIEEG